jgi:hypothetical protein
MRVNPNLNILGNKWSDFPLSSSKYCFGNIVEVITDRVTIKRNSEFVENVQPYRSLTSCYFNDLY